MKEPVIPDNEEERLEALRSYDMLDTTAEEIFDHITWIAALVCNVSNSCISLVDRNRQFFKSSEGNFKDRNTPRNIAFCAHTINQSDLMEIQDATKDERFHDNPLVLEDPGIRFYAGMPLINPDNYKIGTLCVSDIQPRQLSPLQKEVLRRLSKVVMALFEAKKANIKQLKQREQSEITLRDATTKLEKSLQKMKERNREMHLLSEMTGMLQACLEEEEAFSSLATYCNQLFPNMNGAIALMLSDKVNLQVQVQWGSRTFIKDFFTETDCWALRRSQVYKVDANNKNMFCKHYAKIDEGNKVATLCVPMMAQGETIGMLCLEQHDHAQAPVISENRLLLTTTLAEQSALALANIKLRKILELQSRKDALTGLNNRRVLEAQLPRILEEAAAHHEQVSIILVDIDHFKEINDTYGHGMGDEVLERIAQVFRENAREQDILCRLGGDEFLLIFPNLAGDKALERAEEILKSISHLKFYYRGSPIEAITLSLGIATFPDDARNSDRLIAAADRALYQAKNNGRNQAVLFDEKSS